MLDHGHHVLGPRPGVSETIEELDREGGRRSRHDRPVHVDVGGHVEAVDPGDEADLAVGGVDLCRQDFDLRRSLHRLSVDPDVDDATADLSLRPRDVVAAVAEVLHVRVLYLDSVSTLEFLVSRAIKAIQSKLDWNTSHCLPQPVPHNV
eukprot:760162-Hanusia_phi.AAC.4